MELWPLDGSLHKWSYRPYIRRPCLFTFVCTMPRSWTNDACFTRTSVGRKFQTFNNTTGNIILFVRFFFGNEIKKNFFLLKCSLNFKPLTKAELLFVRFFLGNEINFYFFFFLRGTSQIGIPFSIFLANILRSSNLLFPFIFFSSQQAAKRYLVLQNMAIAGSWCLVEVGSGKYRNKDCWTHTRIGENYVY